MNKQKTGEEGRVGDEKAVWRKEGEKEMRRQKEQKKVKDNRGRWRKDK